MSNSSSAIKILSKIVSIHSEYPNESDMGDFVYSYLQKLGFKVKRQFVSPGRFNVLAEIGKGSPGILIFGHLDTVTLQEGWHTDPFELTLLRKKAFGLGAWDMKGGLAAVLDSVKDIDTNNIHLKLAFFVDEENFSIGACQGLNDRWFNDCEIAITSEPGFNFGIKGVALGRIGRAVFNLKVRTGGGHVHLSNTNHNAITESAKIIELFSDMKTATHPKLGESRIFPRNISGGVSSMSIPELCEIEFEYQLIPPQTPDSILITLKELIFNAQKNNRLNAKVEVFLGERPTPFPKPYLVNVNNPNVQKILDIQKQVIGRQPKPYYRRSVGDENRVAERGIQVLTIGPDGGNAHLANEWVDINSLNTLVSFYRKIFLEYAS